MAFFLISSWTCMYALLQSLYTHYNSLEFLLLLKDYEQLHKHEFIEYHILKQNLKLAVAGEVQKRH